MKIALEMNDQTATIDEMADTAQSSPRRAQSPKMPGSFAASLNAFVLRNSKPLEMVGVLMRIASFSLVSWLGSKSPFLIVWIFNSLDAVLLSWCAVLKKDLAYSLLNCFWILVGVVGILRSLGVI